MPDLCEALQLVTENVFVKVLFWEMCSFKMCISYFKDADVGMCFSVYLDENLLAELVG